MKKVSKPKKEWLKVFISRAPRQVLDEIDINRANPSSRRRKSKPLVKDYAVSLVVAGFTRKDVAREFGISDRLLGTWLAEHRAGVATSWEAKPVTMIQGELPIMMIERETARPSLWNRIKSWFS
jgi:transposase-like protein